MYAEPYQPMSESELKASVMRGIAVAIIVLSLILSVGLSRADSRAEDPPMRRGTWICRGKA